MRTVKSRPAGGAVGFNLGERFFTSASQPELKTKRNPLPVAPKKTSVYSNIFKKAYVDSLIWLIFMIIVNKIEKDIFILQETNYSCIGQFW